MSSFVALARPCAQWYRLRMNCRAIASILTLSLAECATVSPAPEALPSTLWVGPTFLTSEGPARALEVTSDGVIAKIYTDDTAPLPPLPRRELPGAFATAGLVDAHLHLAWLGRIDEQLDLSDATSAADVATRVARFAKGHPYLRVIEGFGWDHTRWATSPNQAVPLPGASDLPDVGVPIVLDRVDGHAVWLDRRALTAVAELLPSGTRTDQALVDPPLAIRTRLIPEPTEADLSRHLQRGLEKARDAGLVEVHDMATSPAELEALLRLPRPLPVRVVVYLDDSARSLAWLDAHAGGPREVGPDVWVAGVKLFLDGALGSRGAALLEDYSDAPGHRGTLRDVAVVTATAVRVAKLGYPVALHAIGDRANRAALDVIEAANRAAPARLPHRIEHAQVVSLDDLDRFAKSGAIASMQPTHATSDMRWAEARLGPERIAGAYAWRTLLTLGVPLVFGSDAPVERVDPVLGLWAATTRQTPAGDPPNGWHPDERLTFDDALAAFTTGAVRAAPLRDPTRTGRLSKGSRADLTLWSADPRTTTLTAITVVGTARGR